MKYVIEIPGEIEQALEKRASDTGSDVPHLIEMAVVSFVRNELRASPAGRRPDPPLETLEFVPPCDLPRTAPRFVPIQQTSHRTPDPTADMA